MKRVTNCIRRKNPKLCCTAFCWPPVIQVMWCWIRFSALAQPARWRSVWGGILSALRPKRNTPPPRKRIAAETVLDDTSLQVTQSAKQQKRVPFGALVENGMLKPGAQLFGPARKVKARIRADGSFETRHCKRRARRGLSIKSAQRHKVWKPVTAWTYWHYKDGDKLLPIDTLREKLRDG